MPLVTVAVETMTEVPVRPPVVNRLYVTVPPVVAVTPVSFAESVTDPPTVIVLVDSVVVIPTPVAGLTVSGSHGLALPLLLASPL